jgi:PAS domain S-box-containing protein
MTKRKPAANGETLRRLRARLREAEDTLRAIRDGHVDALIVDSPEGDQLYTLRSADQPYRLMVEQMREGALTLSADGTILYCNDRFAQMVGGTAREITARNLRNYIAANDRPRFAALLEADACRDDFQLVATTERSSPVQLSSIALVIEGVRTVAVVVSDLTHEHIGRGLRETNRLKDEFLATLSHELRTPLNVILGWTRMLLADDLPESSRHHALQLIERNAQAQAQLVNDLVDMSRVTTGKLKLDLEMISVVPALEAAIDSIRPAAEAKAITLRTTWNARSPRIAADATRLQQILWNLLSNAVKFTAAGGTISVGVTEGDGQVRISVADTGVGIDRSFLPHVFDRFRQADGGSTRAHGGLGLGLAIVHDLVRLHGGEVRVESDGLGKGTTFILALRQAPAGPLAPDRRPRSRQSASLAGRRIVVVEDHHDSRDLMRVTLEGVGAAVRAFATSAEALTALERIRPSAVVADIGLPGEDGYEFIRKVRKHSVTSVQSVPAIAVTAYATPHDRALALDAGFQRHLTKPFDPEVLIDAIQTLVGPKRKR